MANGEYASCPNCGKYAYGREEIEQEFGYRYNGTKPQSWCKECRSEQNSSNNQGLSVSDAALYWLSNGMDEDHTFGYTEEELREELKNN